jgi:pimeloyl-ACP methyl ester carboxylesterase
MDGAATWRSQYPLADRWTLAVLDRRSYFENSPGGGDDFEVDALDIAEALADGAHVVAHSYGGLGALLAAAARPTAVHSLTLIEPIALSIAMHVPAVRRCVEECAALWATETSNPRGFLERFSPQMGVKSKVPDPLPTDMEHGTRMVMRARLAFTADVPLRELARAHVPSLIISGGHSPVFESICDVLRDGLMAERAVLPGAGHVVPRIGSAFNEQLDDFLSRVQNKR